MHLQVSLAWWPPGCPEEGVLTQGGVGGAAAGRGSPLWQPHSGRAGPPSLWPGWNLHRRISGASPRPRGGRSGQPDAELWHQNCLCPVGGKPVRAPFLCPSTVPTFSAPSWRVARGGQRWVSSPTTQLSYLCHQHPHPMHLQCKEAAMGPGRTGPGFQDMPVCGVQARPAGATILTRQAPRWCLKE